MFLHVGASHLRDLADRVIADVGEAAACAVAELARIAVAVIDDAAFLNAPRLRCLLWLVPGPLMDQAVERVEFLVDLDAARQVALGFASQIVVQEAEGVRIGQRQCRR